LIYSQARFLEREVPTFLSVESMASLAAVLRKHGDDGRKRERKQAVEIGGVG